MPADEEAALAGGLGIEDGPADMEEDVRALGFEESMSDVELLENYNFLWADSEIEDDGTLVGDDFGASSSAASSSAASASAGPRVWPTALRRSSRFVLDLAETGMADEPLQLSTATSSAASSATEVGELFD